MSLFRKNKEPEKVSGFGVPETYKSKYKIVAWFKNYWYYYRVPFIFAALILILVVWFTIDMATKKNPDARFYIISDTQIISEQYEKIPDKITPYITDLNEDGNVSASVYYLNLAEEPQDEVQMAAYQQIVTIFYDEMISVLLVDDYAYNYLMQSDGLEPLSTFGITGGIDDYRIPVRGTSLTEGTTLDLMDEDFYLVFRVVSDMFEENEKVSQLYSEMAAYAQMISDESAAYSASVEG